MKQLVDEDESVALEEYVRDTGPTLVSSALTLTELARSTARFGVPTAVVDALLARLTLVALTAESLRRAGALPSPPGTFLRAADAIHLVAAIDIGAATFLTYDRRQAQAAAAAGMAVLAPGRPDGWAT